jgi:hypothetical protein
MIRLRSSGVSFGYRPLFAFPTTTPRSGRSLFDPPSCCSDPQNPPSKELYNIINEIAGQIDYPQPM